MAAANQTRKEQPSQPGSFAAANEPRVRLVHQDGKAVSGSPTTRITTDDRSYLNRPDTTRNVRTSTMPGTPKNSQARFQETTSEAFTRKQYHESSVGESILKEAKAKPKSKLTSKKTPSTTIKKNVSKRMRFGPPQQQIIRKLVAEQSVPTNRARLATFAILMWSGPLYLFFQLPFAIFSAIFLGISLAVGSLLSTSDTGTNTSFIVKAAKVTFSTLVEAVDWVSSHLLGFKLSMIPDYVFVITWGLLIAYAIFLLFSIYLIYTFRFLKPLSGSHAGLKIGMFLLALIGYLTPLLNLLPWAGIWIWAVTRHPK